MNEEQVQSLLEALAQGDKTVEEALAALVPSGGEDLGYARIDEQREARCGFPEVIYGAGKTSEQILGIARHFHEKKRNLLVTRLATEAASSVLAEMPDAEHDELARTLTWLSSPPAPIAGTVAVVSAGTSDLAVAGECTNSLSFFGIQPREIVDVGVAGIHRLLARSEELAGADVVVVIAGMEGALPSVVGGLIAAPVIAVPTSAGYGTSFGGVTALLGMLNSCASGVTVTNIDNGFGAACAALRILRSR